MISKRTLFFVEDDLSFGTVLKSYLEINGFEVTWLHDGRHAISTFREKHFDLCLLDVMLPHVDGFTLGKEIRLINNETPIIYLTAKSLKEDILTGYKIGADDYIVKPFDAEVLIVKLNALFKRIDHRREKEPQSIKIGTYIFNPLLREISRGENAIALSPKEAALLLLLCEHKEELLPRELALKRIWGDDGYFTTRSMDVFITKLRKLFREDPTIEIKNIHGAGFILTIKQG